MTGCICSALCDSQKRPGVTRYGVIGTREGVERFRRFSAKMRGYIPVPVPGPRSRKIEPQHVPFPGFQEAFNSEWPEKPAAVIQDIQLHEIEDTIRIQNRHEAIHGCVDLFVSRLEQRRESPRSAAELLVRGHPGNRLRTGPAAIASAAHGCRHWKRHDFEEKG